MYLFPTCALEVQRHINKLKAKTSTDVYGLSIKTVKVVSDEISNPMAHIINACFEEGIFPRCLKWGEVVPIHKKGDHGTPANYRPITILPAFGKIIESILTERITDYISYRRHLAPNQFGFQKGKGTVQALEELMQYIRTTLEEGQQSLVSFYDLTKAFDCVPHDILLEKLERYGIRGGALKIICSYLEDRQQSVKCHGQTSKPRPVKHGVAQGSLIGPILFILYVNDLPSCIDRGEMVQYADDTTYHTRCHSKDGGIHSTGQATTQLQNWFETNKLALNIEKTKMVHFFTTRRENLETQHAKFLGVTLDSRLTWLPHVDALAKTLSTACYAVRKITQCVNKSAGIQTYYALFHSRMTYCLRVWGLTCHASKIFVLQKRTVRAIEGATSEQHCRPLFAKYHILTLPSEVILHSILAMHRQRYPRRFDIHDYNTRHKDQIAVPYNRLRTTDSTTMAAKLYNALPAEMQTLPLQTLKRKLKNVLQREAFYSVEEFLIKPHPFNRTS